MTVHFIYVDWSRNKLDATGERAEKEYDQIFEQFDDTIVRGMLKIMVLVHLKKTDMHPYAMLKHFRSSPMFSRIKKSDVYNTINSLEKEGYVKYKAVKKGAQTQKRYELTAKGNRIMARSKRIRTRALKDLRTLIESEFSG